MRMKALRTLSAALVAAGLWGLAPGASAVTLNITYTDSPGEGFLDPVLGAQRRACIEAAAANWADRLEGSVPIEIHAAMDSMPGGTDWAVLGGAGAGWYSGNFNNAPVHNVYYSGALANQLAGTDLEPNDPEIYITYNSDVDGDVVLGASKFYYGTDGRVTFSTGGGLSYYNIDFYQTCLHEIGHGLGLTPFVRQDGSWNGGYPHIYDTFLATADTAGATRLTALDPVTRAQRIVQNTLFFAGSNARMAAGGVSPKLYAPNPYEAGSSVAHLDENTYSAPWTSGSMPNARLNETMTPRLGPGTMHHNGPLVAGVLKDLGWRLRPFTFSEVATGLRDAAGVRAASKSEVVRLQRYGQTVYPGRLTLTDAIAAARAAAGTDADPHFLGTP